MLQTIRLKDFILVDDAEIDFRTGFTALTGETGAGKSILLDAVGLLLGARADAAVVREGAGRADLSAHFAIDDHVRALLDANDLAGDDADQMIVRRTIDAEGRSRAHVNGHPVTVAQLRAIGERLVDIHGQHESQALMRAGAQRDLLDRFGRLESDARHVARAHDRWSTLERQLAQARNGSREIALRCERLQWEIEQIDALELADGEWTDLSAEQHRLAHARELIEGCDQASEALARGDEALADRLRVVAQRIKTLGQLDARLLPAAELLDTAAIQIDEAASDLAAYAQRTDLDPQRLAEVEARVAAIFDASRKLKITPDELPVHLDTVRAELATLQTSHDVEALEAQATQAREAFMAKAGTLSAGRRKAAARLAREATVQMKRLGMADAELLIACDTVEPTSHGIDAIEFRIQAHPGATPRAIARYASGGELSRIGLAIAVVAAEANPVPVLIFDEADTGIGGAVAAVVGELLQRLGNACQVLCVTHLPQVASRADHHMMVSKSRRGVSVQPAAASAAPARGTRKSAKAGRTVAQDRAGQIRLNPTASSAPTSAGRSIDVPDSRVELLSEAARIDELARMLGAKTITDTTRANAREMLESGRRTA